MSTGRVNGTEQVDVMARSLAVVCSVLLVLGVPGVDAQPTVTVTMRLAEVQEQERQQLDQLWRQRLERAAYESERAARHYRLVEPEHRMVARQLAKEWEDKLTIQRQLQEEYQRFLQKQPRPLSRAERETIEKLAQNIPSLWHAPRATRRVCSPAQARS